MKVEEGLSALRNDLELYLSLTPDVLGVKGVDFFTCGNLLDSLFVFPILVIFDTFLISRHL